MARDVTRPRGYRRCKQWRPSPTARQRRLCERSGHRWGLWYRYMTGTFYDRVVFNSDESWGAGEWDGPKIEVITDPDWAANAEAENATALERLRDRPPEPRYVPEHPNTTEEGEQRSCARCRTVQYRSVSLNGADPV